MIKKNIKRTSKYIMSEKTSELSSDGRAFDCSCVNTFDK